MFFFKLQTNYVGLDVLATKVRRFQKEDLPELQKSLKVYLQNWVQLNMALTRDPHICLLIIAIASNHKFSIILLPVHLALVFYLLCLDLLFYLLISQIFGLLVLCEEVIAPKHLGIFYK